MSDIELYPAERLQLIEAWAALQRKYSNFESSKENLMAFATEAENRCRDLGFKVAVDISNLEMSESGELYVSPIISIEGRVTPEEYGHDHERHAVEVQDGMTDGVEGSLTPDGKLTQRKIVLPR